MKARLWATPEGDFLGVRPPVGGKAKKRKRTGPLSMLASPWLAVALLLLIAAFLYLTKPTLIVTPAEWTGPLGSRVEYKIEDQRWFFFEKDVTPMVVASSNDPRVMEFDRHAAVANAKSIGRTGMSFILGNRAVYAQVEVGPPKTPHRLTIEPADDVRVAIGATRRLKAIGHYDDGNSVDLTSQVSWWEVDDKRHLVINESEQGLIEGDSAGATVVMAQFPIPRDDDSYAEAQLDVQVVLADFTTLTVSMQPETFAVGQSSRVDVSGITADGAEHSLVGSSLLKIKVDPTTLARVDGGYLIGRAEGEGRVQVSYSELEKNAAFTVEGRALDEDLFIVKPLNIENSVVHELIPINVATGSDLPIEADSADDRIVQVFSTEGENAGYEIWLAARSTGKTEVTVSQGDKSASVQVTVTDGTIESMEFRPPVMTLKVGQPKTANLIAITDDNRIIKVVPDVLTWLRQPRLENVLVEKDTLLLRPLQPTQTPQSMEVCIASPAASDNETVASADLSAAATIEVAGQVTALALEEIDEETWGVHPPVPARGQYIGGNAYLGEEALLFDNERGGLVIGDVDAFHPLAHIPNNAVITDLNGVSLVDMNRDELAVYLRGHPIGDGSLLRYRGPDGVLASTFLGDSRRVVQDWKLLDVESSSLTTESFDALLRMYVRQAADYRLTDAAGTPLSDWTSFPAESTPSMVAQAIPRNADDDYELYVERRIDDRLRKFQVSFKLEGERMQRVVDDVDLEPAVRDVEPSGTRVRERVRIKIPKGADPEDVQRAIDEVRSTSKPTSMLAPGSTSRAPNSPAPNSSPPNSSPPNSTPPGSPAPNTAPPSDAPPSAPSPSSPPPSAPTPDSPTPDSPAPAPPGSPPPGSPAPPNAKPAPAPASPAPAPPGSDTRAPDAAPKPAPGAPAPGQPSGSDTRAPSAFRSRTPSGSGTRAPVAGDPSSAAPAPKGETIVRQRPPVLDDDEDGGEKKSKFVDALKKYNRRND